MCGQVSHGTDTQVCFIPHIFTFYKAINNFQSLYVLIFCVFMSAPPKKKKIEKNKNVDSVPVTDRQSE